MIDRAAVQGHPAIAIRGLTARHPSRTLVLAAADPDGPGWLDARIEAAAGTTIPELFATEGETAFRARERAAVAALDEPDTSDGLARVIATGGGTVVDPRNRWRLYRGRVPIWLDLAPEAARPWVADAWAKFREEGSQSGAMVIERPDGSVRHVEFSARANVAPGFALGDRLAAVHEAVEKRGLPRGFGTRVIGRGRELERTFKDFAWTFMLSFIFMYIILAAQFEHLIHPLTILFSLPLAVPFGLLSLWLGNETISVRDAPRERLCHGPYALQRQQALSWEQSL